MAVRVGSSDGEKRGLASGSWLASGSLLVVAGRDWEGCWFETGAVASVAISAEERLE